MSTGKKYLDDGLFLLSVKGSCGTRATERKKKKKKKTRTAHVEQNLFLQLK